MRYRFRFWPQEGPHSRQRGEHPDRGDGNDIADLDQWLALTGSDAVAVPGADQVLAARRLQAGLLRALDEPRVSIPVQPYDLSEAEEWASLPPEVRAGLRWMALRRLDPRLVWRTLRHGTVEVGRER